MASHNTQQLTREYLETIWNQQQLDQLSTYLHPQFRDHSLPATLSPDQQGLRQWIQATSAAFLHQTRVEDQVSEGDKTMLRITMQLTHIGQWRGIAPTGAQVSTRGYRFFRLQEGKIIEHWALLDATSLENQLKQPAAAGGRLPGKG